MNYSNNTKSPSTTDNFTPLIAIMLRDAMSNQPIGKNQTI